jgi:prevent-host-death family protein
MDTTVSIGQVKRDISELVNRVAYRGEHIVLTSRGKPKAVLIGLEEYERLKETGRRTTGWANWLARADEVAGAIHAHGGDIDLNALLSESRKDLEKRGG